MQQGKLLDRTEYADDFDDDDDGVFFSSATLRQEKERDVPTTRGSLPRGRIAPSYHTSFIHRLVERRALPLDGIRRKRSESHEDWWNREDLSTIHRFTRTLYYRMAKAADSVFYCLF